MIFLVSVVGYTLYGHKTNVRIRKEINIYGCGRKKSPILEANKFKTKEDTANIFFLFLESTQNAVLHQCVLNKTSFKWQP